MRADEASAVPQHTHSRPHSPQTPAPVSTLHHAPRRSHGYSYHPHYPPTHSHSHSRRRSSSSSVAAVAAVAAAASPSPMSVAAPSLPVRVPRQPGPGADGYFPGGAWPASGPPAPASAVSASAGKHTASPPAPPPAHLSSTPALSDGTRTPASAPGAPTGDAPLALSRLSSADPSGPAIPLAQLSLSQSELDPFAQNGTPQLGSLGPPSPSTLTDTIADMHRMLYGSSRDPKRTPEQVAAVVARYYDPQATFQSPLLSASGWGQIASQFAIAFALPGIDIHSCLHDIVTSDFEFDRTRAGILEHTLTITLFPSLFNRSSDAPETETEAETEAVPGESDSGPIFEPHTKGAKGKARPVSRGAVYTPHYPGQVTPHPFASYTTASAVPGSAASNFSLPGGQRSYPHSPLWSAPRMSRPPSQARQAESAASSAHPNSSTDDTDNEEGPHQGHTPPAPPAWAGSDGTLPMWWYLRSTFPGTGIGSATPVSPASPGVVLDPSMGRSLSDMHVAGPGMGMDMDMQLVRGAASGPGLNPLPPDAMRPHWAKDGFGRAPVQTLLRSVLHPSVALRRLLQIDVRIMTRLEFNDAGLVIRHDDMWGLKEAIEGIVPIVGLIYPIERRLLGWIVARSMQAGWRLNAQFVQAWHTILSPYYAAWYLASSTAGFATSSAHKAASTVSDAVSTASAIASGLCGALASVASVALPSTRRKNQ